MSDGTQPVVLISGMPADTFSTLQRDVARGRLFSERFSPEQTLFFDPATRQIFRVTSVPGLAAPGQVIQFILDGQRFPRNLLTVPGGPAFAATGVAEIRVAAAVPARVVVRVTGLGALPPGSVLTVWLLHDIVVPSTLDAQDLAVLPRLAPTVNQPGQLFTLDGQPNRR